MSDIDDDNDDGNYEDFMVSEDESLQMEFESEEDEKMQDNEINIEREDAKIQNTNSNNRVIDVIHKVGLDLKSDDLQSKLNQLIISAEELMNNGKWDEARYQYSTLIRITKSDSTNSDSLVDLFPFWINLMNCWSRNLYYNTNEINTEILFDDCHQFADYIYERSQQNGNHSFDKLPEIEITQLQQLINNILPIMTKKYMFEINEINLTQLQERVRLQLSLCQELEKLTNVNKHIKDLINFKKNVGRQWERIIALGSKVSNISNLIDLILFDDLIKSLLEDFNCGIIKDKSFEQDFMIRKLGILFQMYILIYSMGPNSETLMEYNISMIQIFEKFEQDSERLLILSQDSSLMLLFHLSFSIQILTLNSSNDQWVWMDSLRRHLLSALQQVERIGSSYDHPTTNEYHQFIFIGFILTSIFLILGNYGDNSNSKSNNGGTESLDQNKILNPFDYEQIKLIGKNKSYEMLICKLQTFYHRVMDLKLCEAYNEIQSIIYGDTRLLNQFIIINKEIFNRANKLKFLYKIIPVYERTSISDLQVLLDYDGMMSRDKLITLLMELRLENNTMASFKIDFVEDHVLLFNADAFNYEMFAYEDDTNDGIGDRIEVTCDDHRNVIHETSATNLFMRLSGVNDDPIKHDEGNAIQTSMGNRSQGNNPTYRDIQYLQLQAARLVSQTLSAHSSL